MDQYPTGYPLKTAPFRKKRNSIVKNENFCFFLITKTEHPDKSRLLTNGIVIAPSSPSPIPRSIMTLSIHFFNFWAVLVCFIWFMALGALWYSPVLFGNYWLKLVGKAKEDINRDQGNKAMMLGMIPSALTAILLALTLGMMNTSSLIDAVAIGSMISAGFIGMSAWNLILFEGRSLMLALVNVGYSFVSMNVAAIILTFWK